MAKVLISFLKAYLKLIILLPNYLNSIKEHSSVLNTEITAMRSNTYSEQYIKLLLEQINHRLQENKSKTCIIQALLTHHISFSDCLYFSRYWAICVLQLFVNQAVTP